jgi:hypothetical protein
VENSQADYEAGDATLNRARSMRIKNVEIKQVPRHCYVPLSPKASLLVVLAVPQILQMQFMNIWVELEPQTLRLSTKMIKRGTLDVSEKS